MNSIIKSLIFCAFFTTVFGADFAWKDCGGSLIHFNKLEISPLPLVLSETSKIYLTSSVALSQDLPLDAEFELTLNKTLVIGGQKFPLTIPCVDGMGSCRLKVCDMFHLWYNDVICPFFKEAGHSCSCPVKAGVFTDNKIEVSVPLNKFKGIAAQLADGDYSIRFSISDPTKQKQFACLDMQMHLTFHH